MTTTHNGKHKGKISQNRRVKSADHINPLVEEENEPPNPVCGVSPISPFGERASSGDDNAGDMANKLSASLVQWYLGRQRATVIRSFGLWGLCGNRDNRHNNILATHL